jgi:threonine/homoserine/homoserine lactone efflux protein
MGEVIAEVLPLAIAIAASPFTIIPAILLLFTPRARATSASFLAAWLVGIAASSTAFALLATAIETARDSPTWVAWARLLLGGVLIVLGVKQWVQRRKPKPPPAWMRSMSSATPRKAVRLALVLALANPKTLLLSAAAGLAIGAAELPVGTAATAILIFTLTASITVVLPVGLYAVLGERILGPLTKARDWLERNNPTVMSIVITVIGLVVLAEGVATLR